MTTDFVMKGLGSRALPQPNGSDPVLTSPRLDRYGHGYMKPLPGARHNFADSGAYFVAHNATNDAATTLAGHAAPVLVDADATMTKPFIHLMMVGGRARSAPTSTSSRSRCHGRRDRHAGVLGGAARHGHHPRQLGRHRADARQPEHAVANTPNLACLGGAVVAGAESAATFVTSASAVPPVDRDRRRQVRAVVRRRARPDRCDVQAARASARARDACRP
jgi:hypothetical protein